MSRILIDKDGLNEVKIDNGIGLGIEPPIIRQIEGQQSFLMFPISNAVAKLLKDFGVASEVYYESVDVHKRIAMLESYIRELSLRIDKIPINRDNYPG